jgi:hypothetical protein
MCLVVFDLTVVIGTWDHTVLYGTYFPRGGRDMKRKKAKLDTVQKIFSDEEFVRMKST